MLEGVLTCDSRYNTLPAGVRIAAAVSGGPDSVCLAHLLKELADHRDFTFAGLVHVNHKLRGAESEGDREFVAGLARTLGVPLFLKDAPLDPDAPNLESSARDARRAYFHELIESGKVDWIATGHTRDDQAETVLFRLLRGTGPAGLSGIQPVTREGLLRPLLMTSRSAVRQWLAEREIAWREDSSNRDPRFSRNRLRHGLIPQLERDWNPQLSANLARLAEIAGDEEAQWDAQVREKVAELQAAGRLIQEADGIQAVAIEIEAAALANLPLALSRRLLRRTIRDIQGADSAPMDFAHIERIRELAVSPQGDGGVSLPGIEVERSFDWLRLRSTAAKSGNLIIPEEPVSVPGEVPSPDGKSLVLLVLCESLQLEEGCVTLRLESAGQPKPTGGGGLRLRGWKPGDRYRPSGSLREWKLKELFDRARVPSWKRPVWPILTMDGQIVWARQFGPAACEAVSGQNPVAVSGRNVHDPVTDHLDANVANLPGETLVLSGAASGQESLGSGPGWSRIRIREHPLQPSPVHNNAHNRDQKP